ncbi:hypothetical protein V8B55DRAFT_1471036, partial [Mucor lusitanicus]
MLWTIHVKRCLIFLVIGALGLYLRFLFLLVFNLSMISCRSRSLSEYPSVLTFLSRLIS